jgi:hypothetical protein
MRRVRFPARSWRCAAAVLLMVAVALVSPTPSVAAATFDASSAVADGAPTSLRATVSEANAVAEASVINLDGGTYTLDVCGPDEGANASGDLDHTVNEPLTINGNGSTIEQTCADQRVIRKVQNTLTIRDAIIAGGELTLIGSDALGGQVYASDAVLEGVDFPGSAIATAGLDFAVGAVVFASSTLQMTDVSASNVEVIGSNVQGGAFWAGAAMTLDLVETTGVDISVPTSGGEVRGGVLWTSGALEATRTQHAETSITSAVTVTLFGGVMYGGVSMMADTVSIASTTIAVGDLSQVSGGALAAGNASATANLTGLTVADTTLTFSGGGSAVSGGAVNVEGDAVLTDVDIAGTNASMNLPANSLAGGAILVEGDAEVAGLVVSDTMLAPASDSSVGGGGVAVAGSLDATSMQVLDTNVSGGQVATDVRGGGLYVHLGTTATELTVARTDVASGPGSLIHGVGAHFRVGGDLTNATFTDNIGRNTNPLGLAPVEGHGGGVYAFFTLALEFVTIADNGFGDVAGVVGANLFHDQAALFATVVANPVGGSNCGPNGIISTWSYSTDTSCALVGAGDTQHGADVQLGALGGNGGTTLTRLPADTSPLADRFAPVDDARCAGADQRAMARPQNFRCDVGAVEVGFVEGDPDPSDPPTTTTNTTTVDVADRTAATSAPTSNGSPGASQQPRFTG